MHPSGVSVCVGYEDGSVYRYQASQTRIQSAARASLHVAAGRHPARVGDGVKVEGDDEKMIALGKNVKQVESDSGSGWGGVWASVSLIFSFPTRS